MIDEQKIKNAKASDYKYHDEMSALNNELINMQQELSKKNIELVNMIEEKNLLLGMVAHDLRNPISIIHTYSQFLLDNDLDIQIAEKRGFLKTIKSSSEFMLSMTDDLLQLSEVESGKLKLSPIWTDIAKVVERSVLINKMLAKNKQVDIIFCSEKKCLMIDIDIYKIEQILNNLMSNAVKFSKSGSIVEVELYEYAGHAVIEVIDKGVGIPDDEIDKLFKPFGKTSMKSTEGEKNTGLGLSIVKRIVENHGGSIKVKSKVGFGTSFFVYLPINRNFEFEEHKKLVKLNEHNIVYKQSIQILVVDDNEVNSRAIELMASKLGHTVEKVDSCEQALNRINMGWTGLVLMDIELKGMDGITACRRIREWDMKTGRHTCVIGLSGHASAEYKKKCVDAGMDDYVKKPLTASMLEFLTDNYLGCSNKIYKNTKENTENDDFKNELANLFFIQYSQNRVELERGLIDSDLSRIKHVCHTLKSSLDYIGAEAACELAKQVEAINRIDIAKDIVKKMMIEIDKFGNTRKNHKRI